MIGMIIPDVTNPFFPAVVRGAEDVAFANGYRLILCNTDNDHAKELAHLTELRTYLPAGLLVIPSNFSQLTQQAESYRNSGAALVCIDRTPRNWSGDTVTVANEDGAFQATEYLLRLGHTKVAAIIGPLHLTNSMERLNGFSRAMKQAKAEVPERFVIETNYNQASGRAAGAALLKLSPRPTAVLAGNDLIAFGVIQAVRDAGLRCPEDISVFGFDNLDMAELTYPALSSVYQPGYQLGTTAAQILIDRVGGDKGPARHVVLATELRIRGSAAAAPSAASSNRWGIG
jgi:LacI family transcriptional regulator